MKRTLLVLGMVVALVGFTMAAAHADLVMTETATGGYSNSQTTLTSGLGTYSVSLQGTPVAAGPDFQITSAGGVEVAGSGTFSMDLSSLDVTTNGAGTLTLSLSEDSIKNLGSFSSYQLSAIVGTSTDSTVEYEAFMNGSTTPIFDYTTTASGAFSYTPSAVVGTSITSLREQFIITSTGAGQISSLDGKLKATVPEPSTLLLMGLGLFGLGLVGLKRRQKV